jgi:hypothetical protein
MPDQPTGDASSPLRRGRRDAPGTANRTSADNASTTTIPRPKTPPPTDRPYVSSATLAARRTITWRRPHPIVIVASALVGLLLALVAGVAVHRGTPTYQSIAALEIDQPRALVLSPDDGVVAKLSRLREKYAGLVHTTVFAQPVAQQLGLPVGVIQSTLSARIDPDSLLLEVGARAHSQAETQAIARAGAQRLVDYTRSEQAADKIPAEQRVTFTVLTPAGPAGKVLPTQRRGFLSAAGAFILATALCLVAAGYVGRRKQ